MSNLSRLLGNESTLAALQSALAAGRLPHAVMLYGPDGAGRGFAARCLAADFLYPEGGPGADGVLAGASPELILVEGEGKSGGIKVDRIRAIRSDVFHSALSAAGRVVWIRDAHRMAPPAFNALLKVLEEPPADVLFILTTHDAAALPATIRSRCVGFPLAPVGAQACAKALQSALPGGADPALPGLLAAVYGGRIGMGLKVLASPARLTILQYALEAAAAAARRDGYTLLRIFAAYEGRTDDDKLAREALLADLADIFAAALRGGSGQNGLPAIDPATAAACIPLVNQSRTALGRNVAYKIETTALAAKLRRATV